MTAHATTTSCIDESDPPASSGEIAFWSEMFGAVRPSPVAPEPHEGAADGARWRTAPAARRDGGPDEVAGDDGTEGGPGSAAR